MILINSAAYVNAEFRNELGLIPPVFLPIGNKKLLSYQVASLQKSFGDEEIFVSLPQDYQLNIDEKKLLEQLNINVVFVPENISLGMAILYVLNTIENDIDVVRLLHGDTLLDEFPTKIDCIALVQTQDDYEWEFDSNDKNFIWAGYFSFSQGRKLVQKLATTQGDFIKSIYLYADNEPNLSYPEIANWHDLGHINTYFRSRSTITTQRAFNSLRIKNGVVWKSGSPAIKIQAEANWFLNLPTSLKYFAPQLIQSGYIDNIQPFYETEYLPILPLNEIFVHGRKSAGYWDKIVGLVANFMREARACFSLEDKEELNSIIKDSNALYADKTYERLKLYANQANIELHKPLKYDGLALPPLQELVEECIEYSLKLPVIPAVVHGDLCFSNIMYDSRSSNIKVIDPRGLNVSQEFSIYGNQTYDLAKLCHSVIGLYDFIIADSFEIQKSDEVGVKLIFNIDNRLKEIQDNFIAKRIIPEIDNKDVIAPTILLFLSMLPLHSDKPHRQEAMLANALRLYTYWKNTE